MNPQIDRKAAIRKYKERKSPCGVFAIRCTTTGRAWVGSSRNLNAARNRYWFALRLGGQHPSTLQAEWNALGEQAFEYEVLEQLKDDTTPSGIVDLLKEKSLQWRAELGAMQVL